MSRKRAWFEMVLGILCSVAWVACAYRGRGEVWWLGFLYGINFLMSWTHAWKGFAVLIKKDSYR